MNDAQFFLGIIAALALAFFIAGFLMTAPAPKHSGIPAGQWKHIAGYHEYAEFVRRNP